MIEIVLRSGQVLQNDPTLGFNADSVEGITETLEKYGSYTYTYRGGSINIPKKEVREVREV